MRFVLMGMVLVGCGEPCPEGTDHSADPAGDECEVDDDCLVTCVVRSQYAGTIGVVDGFCDEGFCESGNSACSARSNYMGQFCGVD